MYATMLPRLEAEETLRLHQTLVAAGELMMEDGPRQKYIDGLQRQANGGRRVKRPTAGGLEAMGIKVRKEPAVADKDADTKEGGD